MCLQISAVQVYNVFWGKKESVLKDFTDTLMNFVCIYFIVATLWKPFWLFIVDYYTDDCHILYSLW